MAGADGLLRGCSDEARNWLPRGHPLVSEPDHRVSVVRDQDPILRRSPCQDQKIGRALGQGFLGAHQVYLRSAPTKTPDELAVDVGITRQSE